MKVVPLAPNVLGVDTLAPLSPNDCRGLVNLGYKWRGGYLEAMSPQEVTGQLNAGLPLLPYTEANDLDPARTLANIARLGLPQGSPVVLDIEGVTMDAQALITKIETWGDTLQSKAYLPCVYMAEEALLTSAEWTALPVYRYHAGAARIQDRRSNAVDPFRGFGMFQGRPVNVPMLSGTLFDVDFHRQDFRGDVFSVIVA
jgi:hypothetical protein